MIVRRALWIIHIAAIACAIAFVLAIRAGHEHPFIYDGIGGLVGFAVFVLAPIGTALVGYTCLFASASVPPGEKVIIGALQIVLIPAWLATSLTGVAVSIWLFEYVIHG